MAFIAEMLSGIWPAKSQFHYSNTWFLGHTRVLNPNDISNQFSRFCRAHHCDRLTDRATRLVRIGCIYVGWWRWAPVRPDGMQPVGVSASVNLKLHHTVQKFSSGTGSPGWSRKKARKTVVEAASKYIVP